MEVILGILIGATIVLVSLIGTVRTRARNQDPFQLRLLNILVECVEGRFPEHELTDRLINLMSEATGSPYGVGDERLYKRLAHVSSWAPTMISDPATLRGVKELCKKYGRTAAQLKY